MPTKKPLRIQYAFYPVFSGLEVTSVIRGRLRSQFKNQMVLIWIEKISLLTKNIVLGIILSFLGMFHRQGILEILQSSLVAAGVIC